MTSDIWVFGSHVLATFIQAIYKTRAYEMKFDTNRNVFMNLAGSVDQMMWFQKRPAQTKDLREKV